jgi:hypothetical protein
MRWTLKATVSALALIGAATAAGINGASATVFTGDLYYTLFTGGANVWKVGYSYNDATTTFTIGTASNIASTNGADGIIFAPNGNLLIGGQGSGNVYEINKTTGALIATQSIIQGGDGPSGTQSYHLALDPSGTKVYTSNFGGPLETVNVPIGTGSSQTNISISEGGLTQVAFAPGSGNAFYVNGSPNGFGNVGTINISTGVTSRIFTSLQPAHGLVYDSFTGLMTMFGAGQTGTFDQLGTVSSLKTSGNIFAVGDFDQGAVDGQGHALIAGSNGITFVDYSGTGDITSSSNYRTTVFFDAVGHSFGGIDDVAPLSGLGSEQTPEPATLALLGAGLAGLAAMRRRRR